MNGAPCTQILVTLRNADPTALTARECLQRSLGYGARLAGLGRSVLWELTGPSGSEAAALIDRLRRSGEIWNPNKETGLVRLPGESAGNLGQLFRQGEGRELFLAWDPERDIARQAGTLLGSKGKGWRLARGVLWILEWREEDPEIRSRLSEEAVLCRGARSGLLVHPHLQDYRRITGDDPPPWLPCSV